MINPVVEAANAFLAITSHLPTSILTFCSLVLGLLVLSTLLSLVWHLR